MIHILKETRQYYYGADLPAQTNGRKKGKLSFHPIFGSRVRDSLILLSGYSKSESLPAK